MDVALAAAAAAASVVVVEEGMDDDGFKIAQTPPSTSSLSSFPINVDDKFKLLLTLLLQSFDEGDIIVIIVLFWLRLGDTRKGNREEKGQN